MVQMQLTFEHLHGVELRCSHETDTSSCMKSETELDTIGQRLRKVGMIVGLKFSECYANCWTSEIRFQALFGDPTSTLF